MCWTAVPYTGAQAGPHTRNILYRERDRRCAYIRIKQEKRGKKRKKEKKKTDLAGWSKRKTGIDPLHGSAHHQENSYQYLEGLGDEEDI